MYNLTNLTNAQTVLDLASVANQFSNGYLMIGFVLAVFLVSLMALKRYDFDDAIAVSSFIAFIVTLLLNFAGLVPLIWVLLFGFMLAFTMFYKFFLS